MPRPKKPTLDQVIGANMREALEAHRDYPDFDVPALASRLGVCESTVYQYMRGERRCSLARLRQIAKVLDVPYEQLLLPLDQAERLLRKLLLEVPKDKLPAISQMIALFLGKPEAAAAWPPPPPRLKTGPKRIGKPPGRRGRSGAPQD